MFEKTSDKTDVNQPRWHAEIFFRTEAEPLVVEHDIEELRELQHIVERGPDWNTIDKIVVTLNRQVTPGIKLDALDMALMAGATR